MEEYFSYFLFAILLFAAGIVYSLFTGGDDPWEDDHDLDDISIRKAGCMPFILVIISVPVAIYFFSWWGLLGITPFWGLVLPIYYRVKRKQGFSNETHHAISTLMNVYGFTKISEPRLAPKSQGPGSIGGEPFMFRVWGSKSSLCVNVSGLGKKSMLFIPWNELCLLAIQNIAPVEERGEELTVAYVEIEPTLGVELIVPWSSELSEFVEENSFSSIIER